MSHTHTTVGVIAIPNWLIRGAITTIVTALITGAAAWGSLVSSQGSDHEKRISVIEDHQKDVDKLLDDIKAGQERVEDKLDRVLMGRKK